MNLRIVEAYDELAGIPETDTVVVSKAELKAFLDKVDLTVTEMMPGIKHLAYHHFKELNEMLIELEQARRMLG